MYTQKSRGPRAEPWGKPVSTGEDEEEWGPMDTNSERFWRYDESREKVDYHERKLF